MVKTSCYENGMKKGAWSEDEDNKLRAYIQRYGHWNWSLLPKFAGVSRSGKSCRLRWMNYLRPNMKHGNFTKEEDDLVTDLHNKLGNKWSIIAASLPGRSDNEIKNRWNIHLKKRAQNHRIMSANNEHLGTLEPEERDLYKQEVGGESSESPSYSRTEISSSQFSGSDCVISSDFTPEIINNELVGNFWTEPFLPDNDDITPSGDRLLSPFNYVNDLMMTDEFLWSTTDTFVEDNIFIRLSGIRGSPRRGSEVEVVPRRGNHPRGGVEGDGVEWRGWDHS